MNQKVLVEKYLQDEPRARERKNKNRAVVNLLLKKFPQLSEIPKDRLEDILQEAATLDRCWRWVTEHRKWLRGADYGSKEELEQKVQIELGYEPGYYRDIKVKQ